jgi:hypothetical protein
MRPLPAACAAAVVVLALVAGCAGGQRAAPAGRATTRTVAAARSAAAAPSRPPASPASASPSAAPGGIFTTGFVNPSLTFTGGSLYLTWQASARAYPPRMTLSRVDPATGAITASNTFSPGFVSDPLYAAGWLWVTDDPASVGDLLLLRLDPRTLMVTGELSAGSHPTGSVGTGSHIAFAGGSIWVDGAGQLVRVSPGTVSAELTIPQPGANSAGVAASPDGGTLIVSEADSEMGTIQRRDPVTGALEASYPVLGTLAPLIGGVSSTGVWVREPTGMLGYIERFQAATMTPQPATQVEGTNGISAAVWEGALWVSDEAAGAARNYCADPATGRRLATLPLPDLARDYLMTVAGGLIYYSVPAADGFAIRTVPVPAACG